MLTIFLYIAEASATFTFIINVLWKLCHIWPSFTILYIMVDSSTRRYNYICHPTLGMPPTPSKV